MRQFPVLEERSLVLILCLVGQINHPTSYLALMAKTKKQALPVILITNDDSINAPGIKALAEGVKDLGRVVVVAPDKPQSGMGHAITTGHPLRLHKSIFMDGIEAYSCSGTPVDCVKL